MKRLLILLLSGFIPLFAFSQSKTVNLTFSEKDFIFEQVGNGYNIKYFKEPVTYPSNTNEPSLPFILKKIAMDAGMTLDSYTFSSIDTLIYQNYTLNSNRIYLPTSNVKYSVEYHEASSPYCPIYPLKNVSYLGTSTLDGIIYADFLVSPFTYNQTERSLYLNRSINVQIKQRSISVGEEILHSPEKTKNKRSNNGTPTISDFNCKYLIITCDSLKDIFESLANWKTQKGVITNVLATEDIDSLYNGSTQQIRIKQAIRNFWEPYNRGVNYVLLGGDIDIVPSQMCYVKHIITEDDAIYTYTDMSPTDWFYGCLDTNVLSWDSNGNGVAGEVGDIVDLTAEAVIARIPVHSRNDARNVVDRIINYEKIPCLNNWEDNILMGGRTYDPAYYMNGHSDAFQLGESMYNYYIGPYWDGEKTKFYDTETDMPGNTNYKFTEDHLQEQLSRGFTFAHIESHGQEYGIQMENHPNAPVSLYYDTIYAKALENSRNTIFTTSACLTNAFDWDEGQCLGEAMMNNNKGGILSYIGNARESWLTNGYTTTTTIANIYKNIFTETYHKLGESFKNAKNNIIGLCNDYNTSWRWMLFSLNMLGDPEMPVYTAIPQKEFENLEIYYSYEDELSINANNDTCNICFMSRDDMGASYYLYGNGEKTLADIENEISFCITAPNHTPYLGVYSPIVHLQNDNINHNYHVIARNTIIGSNVTNNRDNGSFIVSKGKCTINSPKGVTINDSFEVKLGAELEILLNNP